jgi:hypothetical protein
MFFVLSMLLLHPAIVPAAALPPLPIHSGYFSFAILTPAPENSPVSTGDGTKGSIQADATKSVAASEPATADDSDPAALSIPVSGEGSGAPVILAPNPHKTTELAGRGMPPKMWFVLGAVEHGAATFDAWSTRRNISDGTAYETNPLLKPFANSGALYAAIQVAPVMFDLLSKQMLRNSHPWVRRMWWVPQTGSTVASVFSGAHNMSIH